MSKNQINREYFKWLTSQIAIPRANKNTYNDLFGRMHETEFVWIVPHDDNRAADGVELRDEFLDGTPHEFEFGASVLEVLIGLSRRTAFNASGEAPIWAWTLISNLGLNRSSDPLTNAKANKVDEILEALIWRTYRADGSGGFFPLSSPVEDQTEVEIWYQMNAYVIEMYH